MKVSIVSFYLFIMMILFSAFKSVEREPTAICFPEQSDPVTELAAWEVQKYVYQRTGQLLPVQKYPKGSVLKTAIVIGIDSVGLGDEEFNLAQKGSNLYIQGGSPAAVLYGAYQYAELLGVRFTLHGDILPDTLYQGSLLQYGKKNYKPLLSVRGLLPFHDFPEGPDLWDEDMYKACMTQMVKMKMNFFSLHTYPIVEPNVWIGLPDDVDQKGNVTYSYPTTLANTSRPGAWGYSAMDTREYCCGASGLFEDSIYASPLVEGLLPSPKDQEQMNLVFNRSGELFDRTFSFGKQLGLQFCSGLESPLSIPKEVEDRLKEKNIDPESKEAKALLYEGVFSRIQKRHPLDFFWLWTPEGWTWGTPSEESVKSTIEDVEIARSVLTKLGNPFGFGLSGWVLGPPDDPKLFDKHLPKTDFMSSLSRLCGQERIDLGYGQLPKDRTRIPVLWLEDDPALTTPQFWGGRLRSDIAESYAAGCDGVIGNFWRTRSIAPNIIAFAQSCWEQAEWNPDFGKPYAYVPAPINDIRIGGTGMNYFRKIKGTEDQYLYNTQRYDLKGYKVKVPNGKYKVTFLFCETKFDKPGQRIFDLKVQDQAQLSGIDVYQAVGRDSIYSVSTDFVEINNYTLQIDFLPLTGPTFLSAFIIEGVTADANQIKGTPYKRCIDVGGGLYKDFEADLSEQVGNKSLEPRDKSSSSLYLDYAMHEFGEEVASEIASVFESLDGTEGSEGHLGFKMPRPAAWITGPGVIKPNENSWEQESRQYAFVDTLQMLGEKVKGKGNKERFNYWLNTFSYLKTMARLGCMRGDLDKRIKRCTELPSNSQQQAYIEQDIMPLRISLSRQWEEMIGYLLQTIYTSCELGTLINLESQTRKTYEFLTKQDIWLESATGKPLPKQVQLSTTYAQSPRLIVLNERSLIAKGESYRLKTIALGEMLPQEIPVLMYRELGKGSFKALPMQSESPTVFSVEMPDSPGVVLEYYITLKAKKKLISYPASAPDINLTWTKFSY